MTQLTSIIGYIDNLLQPALFTDLALNGLQVDSGQADVRNVACAVDAGLSIIEKALALKTELLIVHHGILWGQPQAVTGIFGEKVKLLLRGNCSLYASHLPLDGNLELGNAAELARFLELQEIQGFCEQHGRSVGAKGKLPCPKPFQYFTDKAATLKGLAGPLSLPFGSREIQHVGIVTGSGSSAITLCLREGIDLLISGEPKQEVYHLAKDLRMNALFLGHYATETFGVRALSARLKNSFDVTTVFIDEPTGI